MPAASNLALHPPMTAAEWWAGVAVPSPDWQAVDAFRDLAPDERRRVLDRVKAGLRSENWMVRVRAGLIAEDITSGLFDGSDRPLSRHLELELEYVHRCGWRPGEPPPLAKGQPVPGCACSPCIGVAGTVRPRLPRPPRSGHLDIDRARRIPVLDVARRLGVGEPRKAGAEWLVRCPLHDDSRPSLRVNPNKSAWFCDVCGEGGDGIRLLMRARRISFADAVRELLEAA